LTPNAPCYFFEGKTNEKEEGSVDYPVVADFFPKEVEEVQKAL
jgi:hypothetical protein